MRSEAGEQHTCWFAQNAGGERWREGVKECQVCTPPKPAGEQRVEEIRARLDAACECLVGGVVVLCERCHNMPDDLAWMLAHLRAAEEERDYWKRLYHEGLDAWHDEITRRQAFEADAQRLTAEVSMLRGACKEKERVGDELIVANARLTAEVARLRACMRD